MERKTLFTKPKDWGSKVEAKTLSINTNPNRTRIEAKQAEMKAALEAKYKNK